MRILREGSRPLSLEELGLAGSGLEKIRSNITKPHGMILVTGPTGSGKTTTLYSILNILNTIEVKVCTIEDPIEYGINRVSQIQVNAKTGVEFSTGLRALLRHDPDIIMVGEIRDQETAEIAIHAALTGHLVLSTLHTNTAAGAVPRFIDMGVEDFLLASTVNVILAQRLVRKICPSCISKYNPDPAIRKKLSKDLGVDLENQKFYKGKGCDRCNQKGYMGRVGIYEVLESSADIPPGTLVMFPDPNTVNVSPADFTQEMADSVGLNAKQEETFKDNMLDVIDTIETDPNAIDNIKEDIESM